MISFYRFLHDSVILEWGSGLFSLYLICLNFYTKSLLMLIELKDKCFVEILNSFFNLLINNFISNYKVLLLLLNEIY